MTFIYYLVGRCVVDRIVSVSGCCVCIYPPKTCVLPSKCCIEEGPPHLTCIHTMTLMSFECAHSTRASHIAEVHSPLYVYFGAFVHSHTDMHIRQHARLHFYCCSRLVWHASCAHFNFRLFWFSVNCTVPFDGNAHLAIPNKRLIIFRRSFHFRIVDIARVTPFTKSFQFIIKCVLGNGSSIQNHSASTDSFHFHSMCLRCRETIIFRIRRGNVASFTLAL